MKAEKFEKNEKNPRKTLSAAAYFMGTGRTVVRQPQVMFDYQTGVREDTLCMTHSMTHITTLTCNPSNSHLDM